MHEVLVNRLEGLSLPRKSVVRLTNRPDMTLNVYRGRKTTTTQQQQQTASGIWVKMAIMLLFNFPFWQCGPLSQNCESLTLEHITTSCVAPSLLFCRPCKPAKSEFKDEYAK